MRRTILAASLALATLFTGAPALAQTVTVKLGTLAPDGSTWHLLLKELGEKWQADSGGRVKLKIFPGGRQGNEGDVIRKMRIGELQAGAVSVVGLRDIDSAPQAMATPGLIDSDEELAYVYKKMAPYWEKKLREKGFIVLSWGDTGWGRMFLKKEARRPSDVVGLKMFAWSGDPGAFEAWKAIGFQPVVVSSTDMLPALSTGMIEGFATSPIMAMTARWYEPTKYMPDVNWGRLGGATIMTVEGWEKIPADCREKLLADAKETGDKINAEVAKMGTDSIEAMQKNGLTVTKLSAEDRAAWQKAAEASWPVVREQVCKPEDWDLVRAARDEYRAMKAGGAPSTPTATADPKK
jgi:TRAP-type C4-dicarboxylate transport system substrate-binding protein